MAVKYLLQFHGLRQKSRFDPKTKIVWASTLATLRLEEEVRKIPIAPATSVTPAQLALEFKGVSLSEGDIVHVATVLGLSDWIFARERLRDDKPGRLTLHYKEFSANRIREQIMALMPTKNRPFGRLHLIKQRAPLTHAWAQK